MLRSTRLYCSHIVNRIALVVTLRAWPRAAARRHQKHELQVFHHHGSWISSNQGRLVRPSFPILPNLQQQFIHEVAKLRVGAVKRQGFLRVMRLVDLRLCLHVAHSAKAAARRSVA